MSAPLPVFLSAYDPAELPGGTLDPLGFTAGYLALADGLFPGMGLTTSACSRNCACALKPSPSPELQLHDGESATI